MRRSPGSLLIQSFHFRVSESGAREGTCLTIERLRTGQWACYTQFYTLNSKLVLHSNSEIGGEGMIMKNGGKITFLQELFTKTVLPPPSK